MQKAAATSIVAATMRKQAAQAQAQQEAAARDAQKARDAAQARAEEAQAAATQIQHQQQALVTQLASLRKTSVSLEKARQDGLAAAAAARAAAAEAARQARLAEQRAKAARDAAARAAARAEAKRAAAEAARQRAAAAAAEKAAAQAAQQQESKPSGPSGPSEPSTPKPPPPPSSNGGVGAVIAYAQAQLGKPYQWGADGPSSFDCSGLTMRAWQQAGVNLYHYTGAQWDQTARVAIGDLRPGDLVFYGSSGPSSHHVGLYVGNGQMIEAPRAGVPVRYASIYRSDLLPYGGRP
jgi:cell wall-associated NlpC family hydrolase